MTDEATSGSLRDPSTGAAVGMATIAAAIGARGLVSDIFRGVESFDVREILLGSIPPRC